MEQIENETRFRVCPDCGRLTPADSPHCEYCGVPSAEAASAAREAALTRRFVAALFTRSNPFTYIFVGINVGVFVLMWLAGGMGVMSTNHEVLIGFGAKENALIDTGRQYWRFITSIFIHIGFLHLFFNNYALWIIGQEIERLYGSSRFVVLYLMTGIIGSVSSYYFNPNATSAGASGAIFGLFGVMAIFAFKYRKEIPDVIARDIKRRVLPLIVINLIFGLSVQGIDNAAHIGGLVSGAMLGLAVPYKRPHEKASALIWRALLAVCLLAVFFSFFSAFRAYSGPRPSLTNLTSKPGVGAVAYFDAIKEADDALIESINSSVEIISKQDASANLSDAMRATERGIESLKRAPQPGEEADRYKQRLLQLLTEQQQILQQFAESRQKDWRAFNRQEVKLEEKHEAFTREFVPWLTEFMKRYGYEVNTSQQGEK